MKSRGLQKSEFGNSLMNSKKIKGTAKANIGHLHKIRLYILNISTSINFFFYKTNACLTNV